MEKISRKIGSLMLLVLLSGVTVLTVSAAPRETIYNSPYVSFSPDGQAWTTDAGDSDYEWYDEGKKVTTGIQSTIRKPETGEHYYKVDRIGEIPVGYWEVVYRTGMCIHNAYYSGDGKWHDINYGTQKCLDYYYSGWNPYCADCGDKITGMLFYMSEGAAESIDYLSAGDGMDYYYLCPHCTNLEMGAGIEPHKCNAISWNKYMVKYEPNAWGNEYGYMEESFHYYNNATEYEGNPVTPETHLRKNTYAWKGFVFTGWNTKPDGSGKSYEDEAEIFNLTTENYDYTQGKGVITLYAQWDPSECIIQIDPAGGVYNNNNAITSITDVYGMSYTVDNTAITPPKGYTVSFETNGGKAVGAISGTQHFVEWSMLQPFAGRFLRGKYFFVAPNGNTDTIRANYTHDPITLPETTRPGYSFGGWYYDEGFSYPAGVPGETIIPDKDMTLYAQWVDLKLTAENNYTANSRKGAVNLSWTQADNQNKSYMLYQSTDGENWKRINTTEDIGTELKVSEAFAYTGKEQKYTIPHTGFYTLTADGAQGGNYGSRTGGKGGSVSGEFWLQKGEVITYTIGGQDGYNGGGAATMYGNGGGCTVVSSDKKGTLLIAGGGGGATVTGDGGAGGSSAGILSTGIEGESGGAGGGGGYRGGSAGEYILHTHTDACYVDINSNLLQKYGTSFSEVEELIYDVDGSVETDEDDEEIEGYRKTYQIGSITNPVSVQPGYELKLDGEYYYFFSNPGNSTSTGSDEQQSSGWFVYNQNGVLIDSYTRLKAGQWLSARGLECTYKYWEDDEDEEAGTWWASFDSSGNYTTGEAEYDLEDAYFGMDRWRCNAEVYGFPEYIRKGSAFYGTFTSVLRDTVTIPEGTTGIYIRFVAKTSRHWADPYVTLNKAQLSGRTAVCGYEEGDIESSKPAYGGSNYINATHCKNYSSESGIRGGNGSFTLESGQIGYLETLELKGVAAPDRAAPDAISLSTVKKEPVRYDRVTITWAEPSDNGTDYYHVAESYLNGSDTPLCRSNITLNTLTTGVCGYFCLQDNEADTAVTGTNGRRQTLPGITIDLTAENTWLHVAPVDIAGNVGETTHIRIGSLEGTEGVLWKLYTEPLLLDEGENIYQEGADKTYYVRSDGITPFTLHYGAYMDGAAREDYQPNHIIFESENEGAAARNVFTVATDTIQDAEITIPMNRITYTAADSPYLVRDSYTAVTRKEKNTRLEAVQTFTLPQEASGKEIKVIPVTGADYQGETTYSDHEADAANGLTLIGDGEAPVISGLDILEDKELIDRREGSIYLCATAVDALSGVKDFYIRIYNTDNVIEQIYTPEADGSIRIEITKDEPIFSGDFTVTAYAVDNVGNERTEEYLTTEFSLETSVERILSPHDPIFKCGESGILTITTWGYADRVEVKFPASMTALDETLNKVYTYTDTPHYRQQEQLQFMVPLYTPENEAYEITVRAYKDGKELEAYPDLSVITVNGTVLDEIRTRLR